MTEVVDPAKVDPPKTDPPKTDPPKTDPPTDPPKTDPPKVDPPKTDPPVSFVSELEKLGFDKGVSEIFKPLEANLTKEQAEKLVEAGKLMKERDAKAQEDFWKDQTAKWEKEIQENKDFGGDKVEANAGKVNHLLSSMKTGPALVEYLKTMNHQNCAPLFLFLAEVSTHFNEDFFVKSGDKTSSDAPAWKKMGYKAIDEY